MSKVEFDTNGGCWLWAAALGSDGYGSFGLNGASARAHRAAWRLFVGPIPDGAVLCHRCDVRSCVNPAHLFLGDHLANAADAARKGRLPRGDAKTQAILCEQDVIAIRARYCAGEPCHIIAADYPAAYQTVWAAARGEKWRHVPSPNLIGGTNGY